MDVKLVKFEEKYPGHDSEVLHIAVSSHGKTEFLSMSFDNFGSGWHMGSKGGLFSDEFGLSRMKKSPAKKIRSVKL